MELTMTSDDVRNLLELFAISSFKPKDSDKTADSVQTKCIQLFARDYPHLTLIGNDNGELSSSYPSKLIVPTLPGRPPPEAGTANGNSSPVGEREAETEAGKGSPRREQPVKIEAYKLRELMAKARVARCRARFPVPVILFEGKYVCRSATLSGGPEIYGRSGLDLLFTGNREEEEEEPLSNASASASASASAGACGAGSPGLPSLSALSISDSSQVFSKVRNQDINLLKYLSVGFIVDLMVEKKKVKFGVNITSSEKADKEGRYGDFDILSLPYPGCEFFRDYRDKGYSAEGLVFDWSQGFVDSHLVIPNDLISNHLDIDWTLYKSWDILKLTRNYMKLLLLYLTESSSSLLIHCISGWDRTPLFVSLLRLSLWADGKVHQNLSPLEMTYLTVAYDWYLFGHNLTDRINKGEEILFFCFYFLKFITTEEYNVDLLKGLTQPLSSSSPPTSASASPSRGSERDVSKNSVDFNMEESLLLEETSLGNGSGDPSSSLTYGGSSTSLNSSCSTASNKSHDNCPPIYFPCSEESVRDCLDRESSHGCARTPPTLTNSEEGSDFLERDSPAIVTPTQEEMISLANGFGKFNVATNRTTPVAIPCANKSPKQSEGHSLSRSESWQIVSDTGSVRDSSSVKGFYSSPDSQGSISSSRSNGHSDASASSGSRDCAGQRRPLAKASKSSCDAPLDSAPTSPSSPRHMRRERLQAVRSIFYNAYSAVVGFRFKNGSESSQASGLSLLFDHFAGSVGIYSNRITAPH